ncbi:hypothetical protein SARC_04041 [Sphaeroforma arctica JP610]|uniref:ATP-dependent Clp protease proteolytic subunit n=1 Tax=Sphaeroforma arctica JP610 TaxID=667725 RepID=A0A0L0G4H2_9EUKA|nr:hypothetical protein SARC_04041 [Sphaeroforma arctica JP610]KNC83711.1 hypothetical protein SARC_04041 [Sphaeroforma arctica JP610]|eukprot:XP_014157613.1 hypothetical protein SARC_04041 [Sphaeroforma arctica JP610]
MSLTAMRSALARVGCGISAYNHIRATSITTTRRSFHDFSNTGNSNGGMPFGKDMLGGGYTQQPSMNYGAGPGDVSANVIPMVIDSTPRGERYQDIFSRLLRERIVCLMTPVNDYVASIIVAQLLFLESVDPTKPISMYINSPGGAVTAGMGIYDTMQYIQAPVSTVCIGQACSMGSLLLTAGEKGQRYALPYSRVMVHQPSGGASGQAADIEIQAREILKIRSTLNDIYVKHTGQTLERIEKSLDRDTFMSAQEAKEYGLIDEILYKRPPSDKKEDGKDASDKKDSV